MKVSMIGAGAIGGWLAAVCIEGGADVTVWARGQSLDALRKHGLRLDDGTSERSYPVKVTEDPAALRGADLLVLGLKAHDLPDILPLITEALSPETVIVPAINGLPWWFFGTFGGPARGLHIEAVDPGGHLAALMPADRIVGSVVHAASYVSEPGKIHLVKANKIWLGDAGQGQKAEEVAALLRAGGIDAEQTDQLHWHVWNKLWGNSNMNPLSALARADVAQVVEDVHTRQLVKTMMQEMSEIGTLIGLNGFDDPDERIKLTRKLGPIRTSMLQDVEAGRAIEIDPILGGLVELAAHLDHPVPALQAIYGLTRMLDKNLRHTGTSGLG